MNILGTKVYSNEGKRSLRAVGMGIVFLHGRANYGIDLLISEQDNKDISLGVDYVPWNNALINLGYSTAFNTKVLGIKYKNLYCTYTNNDELGESYLAGFKLEF